MRVVLDVNILAPASVFPERQPGMVLERALSGDFLLIQSDPVLERLAIVLTRPCFDARLSEARRNDFMEGLKDVGELFDPDSAVRGIAPNLEDDLVLGSAVAAQADYLVTGDEGLLAIDEYRGVRIVTAERFLTEIDAA